MTMTNLTAIVIPDEMKNKCVCCDKKSQHTDTIKCRFRPGYDDKNKVWTDLLAEMTIAFCAKHWTPYLDNKKAREVKYGSIACMPSGADWWDILDGVEALPEYEYK